MLRTLIIDDHYIVRQGLKENIDNDSDTTIITEMCSGKETFQQLQQKEYDVIIIGVTVSTADPIELLKQIKVSRPDLPVLILSALDEEQYYGRLLRAGVSGILTKESVAGELVKAITRVASGRSYISPAVAEKLSELPVNGDLPLPDTLSDREYEVMVSLASGKRIKQIAIEMSLSVKTVSTYHSRILQKLRLENDAQLIRYAIEKGIIKDSITAREKLVLSELNIKTAPLISTIKEIWNQRKLVIIVIAIVAILAYIVFAYLFNFITFIF